ncbi:MAG: urea ABC transporter permease subunit UrtC, partial [Cyanobacteria bacterium J06607_6]
MATETSMRPRQEVKAQQSQQRKLEIIGIIAFVVLMAVVLPLVLSGFRLGLLGRFLSLAIVALGIDLIWGFTGLLSLGHGIFFALGGYAFAMFLQLNILGEGQIPEFFGLYGV